MQGRSGRGTIFSYVVEHRSSRGRPGPGRVIAVVELAGGRRVMGYLEGVGPGAEGVRVGMPVVPAAPGTGEGSSLPSFKPGDRP